MLLRFSLLVLVLLAVGGCLEPPKKGGSDDLGAGDGRVAQDSNGTPDARGPESGEVGRCEPACNDLECGDNGCGGTCGLCGNGETCLYGRCVPAGTECVDSGPGNRNDGCEAGHVTDFQVNAYSVGDQFSPVIAAIDTGDFAVSWSSCPFREFPEETSPDAQDGAACGVMLRGFSPDGEPRTVDDIIATAVTSGAQKSPGFGVCNGGFVLAWNSAGPEGWRTWFRIWNWDEGEGIWEAIPEADDVPAALRGVSGDSLIAAAAGETAYDIIVAWEGDLLDGGQGILARHFGRHQDVWDEILSDDQDFVVGSGYQEIDAPAAVGLNNDRYAILWEAIPKADVLKPDQGSDVYGVVRRYDGQPLEIVGPYAFPFELNKTWLGGQRTPSGVSTNYGDSLVVVFAGTREDGILVRRFDMSAATAKPEWSISAQPEFDTLSPQIAQLTDGRFVVVWQTDGMEDDPSGAIYARILDADLKGVGEPIHVNSYTFDWQSRPQVAALPSGEFVVVWESCCHQDGAGWGVFAKRFDSDGEPIPFVATR